MIELVATVHILVAIVLVFLVLIQDSKGAMGGVLGGGGSNTLFGASGATSFIVKVTRGAAIVFAGTCIALTIMSSNQSGSVVDDYVPTANTESSEPANLAPEANKAADKK